jgi:hypothetical protein
MGAKGKRIQGPPVVVVRWTAAMVEKPNSADAGLRLQTLRPKFQLRAVGFFFLCFAFLGYLSYARRGPIRVFYGGLCALGAVSLIVQYRRESALVHNRLSAVGVVTEYKERGKGAPHLGKGVPVIKYEFVAFDQKSYKGSTGWRAAGLYQGAQITVLYNPENPAANHPLSGFIFYSFE